MFDKNSEVQERREYPELIESILSEEAFDGCNVSIPSSLFTLDNSILISRKVIMNALYDLVYSPDDTLIESWLRSPPFEYHCIASLWDADWVRKIFNQTVNLSDSVKYKIVKELLSKMNKMPYD
jgi:hypothetical protein